MWIALAVCYCSTFHLTDLNSLELVWIPQSSKQMAWPAVITNLVLRPCRHRLLIFFRAWKALMWVSRMILCAASQSLHDVHSLIHSLVKEVTCLSALLLEGGWMINFRQSQLISKKSFLFGSVRHAWSVWTESKQINNTKRFLPCAATASVAIHRAELKENGGHCAQSGLKICLAYSAKDTILRHFCRHWLPVW